MSKTPKTFYRIYGNLNSIVLIPLREGTGVSQDKDGSYYYEFTAEDPDRGDYTAREYVYPSKHLAWEKVKSDIKNEISQREKSLEAVLTAWMNDSDSMRV
jgi:hypothetical protein